MKDLAIEQSLKTYEEVWLSKIFELRLHIRSKADTAGEQQVSQQNTGKCNGLAGEQSSAKCSALGRQSQVSRQNTGNLKGLASNYMWAQYVIDNHTTIYHSAIIYLV